MNQESPINSARGRALAAGVVFLVGLNLLAYSPSFRGPWVFDDRINILENADIIRVGYRTAPWYQLLRPQWPLRRPLANLSFALHLRWFGPDPFSFHLGNFLIHLLNAGLVFVLLRKFIRLYFARPAADQWPPLFGALLWSLHPIQTQAVTYTVQRMTSLAALFYLLALWCWISGRGRPGRSLRPGRALAALVAAGLGFLVKETLVTLPLVIVLWELSLNYADQPFRARLRFLALAGALVLAYAAGLMLCLPRLNLDVADNLSRFYPAWIEKLLSQPRVLWYYLSLLAFPAAARLNADPSWVNSLSLWIPRTTLPAGLALAAVLLLGFQQAKSRPAALFVLLFFLLVLLPESALPMDPVFEHRLYLPSTALLGALGTVLSWPGRRQTERRLGLLLAAALLSLLTFRRNQVWTDEIRLWRDTVRKSPEKARPWNNLAGSYEARGRTRPAAEAYQQAARVDPENFISQVNLSRLYLSAGEPNRARAAAELAVSLKPQNPWAWLTMGNVENAAGNYQAAQQWFQRVWDKRVADPGLLEKLAEGFLDADRPDLAQAVADRVHYLFPGRPGNHLLSGNIFFHQGRYRAAADQYEQELSRDPDSTAALNNLGMAWLRLGRPERAREVLARALELNPGEVVLLVNLCEAEAALGRLGPAEDYCRQAATLSPSFYPAWKNLAEIYVQQGRKTEAAAALTQVRRLAPQDPEVEALVEQLGGPETRLKP